jgi:cytochrome c-type biogenesis protein CcmH
MRRLFLALFLALAGSSWASTVETLQFDDPAQEASYKRLIAELRCLVCQNQNLADSDAGLAKDLRAKTYSLLQEGRSEQEVVDYMVQRYGDFVLYRPPLQSNTLVLWVGPFIILALGFWVLMRVIRRRRGDKTLLSEAERARIEALLDSEDSKS